MRAIWIHRTGWAVAGAALWISLLRLPATVPTADTDDSWCAALGYLLEHHAQAGRDYVFTYGPLGFFTLPAYDSDLFAAKFVWELCLKGIFACLFMLVLARQRSGLARVLFYLTALALPLHPHLEDPQYVLALLLVGVLLMGRPDTSPLAAAGGALLVATLSLVKFTLLLTGVVVMLAVAVAWIVDGRWRRGALLGATFVAGILAVWALAGQSLANLVPFLRVSWEMSTAYSEAMSIDGESFETVAGLVIVLLLSISVMPWRTRPVLRWRDLPVALLFVPVMWLYWKAGFVRQDVHSFLFFAVVQPLAFVLPVALDGAERHSRRRVALWVAAGVLSSLLLGHVGRAYPLTTGRWPDPLPNLRNGGSGLLDPAGLSARLEERERSLRSTEALPRVRRMVRDETIDAFGNQQNVLLLNGLNWRPRPLFQSYAAYTPRLAERNAAFFEGPEAPRYVLMQLAPIDERVPSLEDGPALLRILAHYRPVASERAFLLLERSPGFSPRVTATGQVVVGFGDPVKLELADGPQVLRLRFEKSWWGELRGLLFKIPEVGLAVQALDGSQRSFRVVPGLSASGFLLNPFVVDTQDLIDLYTDGKAGRTVVGCVVLTSPAGRSCYRSIRLEVENLSAVTAPRLDNEQALALRRQLEISGSEERHAHPDEPRDGKMP